MRQKPALKSATELKSPDPSGFDCQDRVGVFKDPLFCNVHHECRPQGKKSYVCEQPQLVGVASVFDMGAGGCVEGELAFRACSGMIYDEEFLFVPAIKSLPVSGGNKCSQSGVSRAVGDEQREYCDLFYWCNDKAASPIYFYCDVDFLTKDAAVFNQGN